MAVNGVGDVIDPTTNKIIASARMAAALRHGGIESPGGPWQYDAGGGGHQCETGPRAEQEIR